jgi:hypothetical protein
LPFNSTEISPATTEVETLKYMQRYIGFISAESGIPPVNVKISFPPRDGQPAPMEPSERMLLQPSVPVPLSDRPLIPLDRLLSEASMYLVKAPDKVKNSAAASTMQPTSSGSQTQAEGSSQNAWESSEEALWKFPPATGLAGMANPTGNARTRLQNIHAACVMRYTRETDIAEAILRIVQGQGLEPFTPNNALCARCRDLGLTPERFIPPSAPYGDNIPREWREELIDFPFKALGGGGPCPLCKLMRIGLGTACSANGVDPASLRCTLFITHFSVYWDNVSRFESFRFLTVVGKGPGSSQSEVSVDLVPVETKQYPLGFIGRLVQPERISPDLIRRWLRQCEQVHGPKCAVLEFGYNDDLKPKQAVPPRVRRLEDLLKHLNFIDVRKNCLTTLSKPERYVALSYVWGTSKSSFTVMANLNERMKPGSLTAVADQISAVILDAISLTRDIGEQYIWIDSLCIVQDDSTSKQEAISKMDVVYENALMTIIAAADGNADDGLPGVRHCSRRIAQEFATIGPDLRLIVPHDLKAFWRSTWASRAWT